MQKSDIKGIADLLSKPRRIVVTTHTNPDGDAIGSSLALYGYLTKKGHHVSVIIPDPDPGFLKWMPFHSEILVYRDQMEISLPLIEAAEVVFCVDYNGLSRLSTLSEPIRGSGARKILIDHHREPENGFDFRLSFTETSSTCELVYDFIEASGDAGLIDKEIASCIYAGIITDTGSFSYSCNYERTYLITADLYRYGIDGEHIHRLVYDTYSESRLRLLGYSISEKLVVLHEFHTAYIALSADELTRFNYQVGDTEDIVNYALAIDGINLAALFSERGDMVRISFRSKGNFSVNEIARKYFDGGGHTNAAGANSNQSLEETIRRFTGILREYRRKLESVY